MPSETTIPSGLSRRKLLQLAALAGAGTPLLAACSGASTSGGGADSITFLSTQFAPVEDDSASSRYWPSTWTSMSPTTRSRPARSPPP